MRAATLNDRNGANNIKQNMKKRYCSVNNWLVDLPSGTILHLATGERKRLGEYQLKLLDVLLADAGKIFTREELTNLVWEGRFIGNNSLPNAIHALRAALEDDGKQQRIIKTVPKKGYLLEPEYCRFIEKDEDEVMAGPADAVTLADDAEYDAGDEPEEAEAAAPPPEAYAPPALLPPPAPRHNIWPGITRKLIAATLVAALSFVATWYFLGENTTHLEARQQAQNTFSNIHLWSVGETNHISANKENLYAKLKDTLYAINQQLKLQSVTMDVYYQSVDQTLNYTFVLKSTCDHKQLAMTIYHWRIDSAKFNNLILRETRRKLNEMATCKDA